MVDYRQKSIEFLISIGFLIPVKDMELYHGRARKEGETGEWQVDPNFSNASNASGNHNVNGVNALATGAKDVATDFAEARTYEVRGKATPEVHRIYAENPNALIINRNFDVRKLTPEQQKMFYNALSWLSNYPLTQLAPVDFKYRKVARIVYDALKQELSNRGQSFVDNEIVDKVLADLSKIYPTIDKKIVVDIAGAMNARKLVSNNPEIAISKFALERSQSHRETMWIQDPKSKKYITCPLSTEYIASWVANNGIIGVSSKVSSATLDRDIKAVFLFDLDSVNTEKALGDKLHSIMEEFGAITEIVDDCVPNKSMEELLKYGTPEQIMATIRNNPRFEEYFALPAGVWEGFSVGEHTETTLRVFDGSFADSVPQEFLPFVRIALIAHDIGKGMAKQNRRNIKTENMLRSTELFKALGIPPQIQRLLAFVIGEAQSYTSDYYINNNLDAETKLLHRCIEVLQETLGRTPTDAEINGLMGVCKIIQNCDSAAYTQYAITRDKESGIYYKNHNPSFEENMEKPTDLARRRVRMKDPRTK